MFVTLIGIDISSRFRHQFNMESGMWVRLLEIVNDDRSSQSANALSPILVTVEGIEMLVSHQQSSNAEAPMTVTLGGIETLPTAVFLGAFSAIA